MCACGVEVIALLSAEVQESLPYHVAGGGVDSNDALYGGDPQFAADVDRVCATLLRQVGSRLRELGGSDAARRQSALALELFGCVLAHGDVRNERVWRLAASLWTMVVQTGQLERRLVAAISCYVTDTATRLASPELTQLAKHMQLRYV